MGRKSREKRERREAPATTVWPVPDPQPTEAQRQRVLAACGLTAPPESGVLTVQSETAWSVEPWLWLPATIGFGTEVYRRLGDTPPVATFLNRDYQVAIFDARQAPGWPEMWHLSIKRRDRQPLEVDPQGRWRILQRIKNTLVGEQNEGVELYPAEARLVDTANQYHLWVLKDPTMRFPFGFSERLVTRQGSHGAVQRPLAEDDDRPTDDAAVEARMRDLMDRG